MHAFLGHSHTGHGCKCHCRKYALRTFAALTVLVLVCLSSEAARNAAGEHSGSIGHQQYHQRSLLQTAGTPTPTPSPLSQAPTTNTGIAKFRKSFARRDLSGGNVPDGWRPSDTKYLEMLAGYAFFGLAMAILSTLAGVFFCMCRGCCNTCGSRRLNPSGYSQKSRMITGTIFILSALVSVIGIYWVYSGDNQRNAGINDSFDAMVKAADDIVLEKDRIVSKLAETQNTYDPSASAPDLNSLNDAMAQLKNQVNDARDVSKQYSGPLSLTIIIVGAVLCLLIVLGIASCVLRFGTIPMVFALLGFLLLFLFWLIVALALPMAVFVSDVCYEFDQYLASTSPTSGVDDLFPCPDVTGGGGLADTIETGLRDGVNGLNTALVSAGAPATLQVTFQITNLDTLQLEVDAAYNAYGSNLVVDLQTRRTRAYLELQREVELLKQCTFVRSLIETLASAVCSTMLRAMDETWFGAFLIGIALIPATLAAILGNKRWRKQPDNSVSRIQAGAAGAAYHNGSAGKYADDDPYAPPVEPTPGNPNAVYGPYATEMSDMSPLKANQPGVTQPPSSHAPGRAPLPPIKNAPLPPVPPPNLAADDATAPALPADVASWQPGHVSLWLQGLGLPHLIGNFTSLGATGRDLLQVTEAELETDFNVTDEVEREVIMGPIRDEVKARRAEGLA